MEFRSQSILILGVNSAIAKELARIWSSKLNRLFIVGRNGESLKALEQDLRVRGNQNIKSKQCDLNTIEAHEELVREAKDFLGTIDVVMMAQGFLGDQHKAEKDWEHAQLIIDTNFVAPASLLNVISNELQTQKKESTIAVITSVAGDRGRARNYTYGASKAALIAFLSGMRNRLSKQNIAVVDIRLGYVDTPMAAGIPKNILFVSPKFAAQRIAKSIDRRLDIAYVPGFWRIIMMIVNMIPEFIFKKMNL